MLLVEIILILVIAAFAMAGLKNGFILTLGKLLGVVIGFVAARAFYPAFGNLVSRLMPQSINAAQFMSFLAIYATVGFAVGWGAHFLRGLFSLASFIPFAKTIGRILGGLLGLGEGVLLIGSCAYVVMRFQLHPMLVQWVSDSTVAGYAQQAFRAALAFFL